MKLAPLGWPKWAIFIVATLAASAAAVGWGVWKHAPLILILQSLWLAPIIAAAIVFSPAIARRQAAIEAAEEAPSAPGQSKRRRRKRRRR